MFKAKSCYVPNCDPTPFQKQLDDLGAIDTESLNVQDKYVFAQVMLILTIYF